ncbi:MAG: lytic transglycosylase domain-containing protein [Burkholderiales bacterium]|nr:lytic transglycosylase domain-containing protein [Burkholderiales bacterium]
MRLPAAVALAALAVTAPARADIWGRVDENGVAHLANHRVDDRYYLFKKEPKPGSAETGPGAIDPGLPALPGARFGAAGRREYSPLIAAVAREHEIEPALLHAVITAESGYNPKARSPRGAIGLMQLMPDTARRYDVKDIWDPGENLRGGARYLRDLIALFGENLDLALAAYNAGEAAVMQHGNRIPPYAETRSYVPRVLRYYRELSHGMGGAPAAAR